MRIFTLPVLYLFSLTFLLSCDPLVTTFEDVEDAVMYKAARIVEPGVIPPEGIDEIVVMTWNIRYGAARIPWFGDSCGDRVILTEDEVMNGLKGLARKINQVDPDIVILQEVDVESKRTAYIDQVQWLLDNTRLNYGAYASYWQIQFIPSDGLGRMDAGNAILTRWEISDAERIPLSLRGDQDPLTRYFYLRRNILKVKIDLPGHDNFYTLGVHTTAFAEDDTKEKHIIEFKSVLDGLEAQGLLFVAGGDLNELPPKSDSTNYCDEARCPQEPEDFCSEGSNYGTDPYWLETIYDVYHSAVSLSGYLYNNRPYFTYKRDDKEFWDRKLDYLFTNGQWATGSDSTHQDAIGLSDHAPVSATLNINQPIP